MQSGGYTAEMFTQDLQQLGGMIEGFYDGQSAQAGGRSRKKSTSTKRKKSTSTKRKKSKKRSSSKKQQTGGVATRAYKILTVNGRKYPYYRRYHGAEPKDAAKKAFHFICKKLNMNKTCDIKFVLQETTRGSKKRTYGPYRGRYAKLPKPRIYKPPGGRKPVKITHRRVVDLIGKSAKQK